jgi:hypothetical protein
MTIAGYSFDTILFFIISKKSLSFISRLSDSWYSDDKNLASKFLVTYIHSVFVLSTLDTTAFREWKHRVMLILK